MVHRFEGTYKRTWAVCNLIVGRKCALGKRKMRCGTVLCAGRKRVGVGSAGGKERTYKSGIESKLANFEVSAVGIVAAAPAVGQSVLQISLRWLKIHLSTSRGYASRLVNIYMHECNATYNPSVLLFIEVPRTRPFVLGLGLGCEASGRGSGVSFICAVWRSDFSRYMRMVVWSCPLWLKSGAMQYLWLVRQDSRAF
jgi:hypothetical protein